MKHYCNKIRICEVCDKKFTDYHASAKRIPKFCSHKCSEIYHSGENNNNWKGGTTPLNFSIRNSFKYRQWRSDVFTRDDFTCQECGTRCIKLHAHHIKGFMDIIVENKISTLDEALDCEELWNINNGITLCKPCHRKPAGV